LIEICHKNLDTMMTFPSPEPNIHSLIDCLFTPYPQPGIQHHPINTSKIVLLTILPLPLNYSLPQIPFLAYHSSFLNITHTSNPIPRPPFTPLRMFLSN
jgi:hypothetical protein